MATCVDKGSFCIATQITSRADNVFTIQFQIQYKCFWNTVHYCVFFHPRTLCIKASYAPHSKDSPPNKPPKTVATSNIDITPKTWTMIYPRHFICTFSWTPYTETFGPFGCSDFRYCPSKPPLPERSASACFSIISTRSTP